MQVGFNHNIKYKGKMYHIQTEDSGKTTMSITTLLYTGGTIISSKKTSYAELTQKDNYSNELRDLMKTQHKNMLLELRHGKYDDPEQAKITESVYEKRKESKTFLDAINSMEGDKLKQILGRESKATPKPAAPAKAPKPAAATKPMKAAPKPVSKPAMKTPEKKATPKFTVKSKPKERTADKPSSEKILDEVILNYLSQDLKRKEKGNS